MITDTILSTTDRAHLVNVLNKKELNFLDFQTLVKYISDAMSRCNDKGFHWLNSISSQMNDDVQTAVNSVRGLSKKLYDLQKQIDDEQTASFQLAEKVWNESYKKHKEMYERSARLVKDLQPIVFPEVKIPYNWKEMLDMVQRLSDMTPEQRAVFYEMVERFNSNTAAKL
jgi:hypothetical protein